MFSITGSTFTLTSGSEDITLGDIKPDATWGETADILQSFTSAGKASTAYWYLTPESAGNELVPGWYATSDEEFSTPMNGVKLPYASALVAKSYNNGGLTYAGAVKQTATEIPVSVFTLTGNVTPASITLGDIVPNANWAETADLIQTFTADGKAATAYWYLTPASAGNELTPGWYATTDEEFATPMNDVTIAAGTGFVVKCYSTGATLTIPSPISAVK